MLLSCAPVTRTNGINTHIAYVFIPWHCVAKVLVAAMSRFHEDAGYVRSYVFFITQDMLANGNCSWYSTTTPALIVIALCCHVIIGNNLLVTICYFSVC